MLSILLLSACSQSASSNNENSNSANTKVTKKDAKVKKEIKKMQQQLQTVKNDLQQKNKGKLVADAKAMHQHWLNFENLVRSDYPLEYTNVEKYETPIYYGLQYDSPNFAQLTSNANGLKKALVSLANAKKTKSKTSKALNKVVGNYENYVQSQADQLVKATKIFTNAVRAGDLEKAKATYAQSRVYYERIEPVAESFGNLDPKIDARINDVDSKKDWTGYHVIEQSLWQFNTTDRMTKYADQLDRDVEKLAKLTKTLKLRPKDMVAGAMDLLQEQLQLWI